MNKKLLSSCLVLSIFAIAIAPIYKQLDLNSSNTVHPTTEWHASNPELVSSTQQQLHDVDYTVTYPQNEEKIAVPASSTQTLSSKGETVTEKTTASSSTIKPVTKTSATSNKTTTRSTSNTSKISATKAASTATSTSTKSTVNRGTVATSTTATSSKAEAVISTAKSFIGVPYVWGGTSPSGFDCSGFSKYVLGKNGITVPRTAAEQYTVGTSVSKINLRVGDLVFFTTYKAGPSHLGFYLGNGDFIHASSSKGVTISNLSSTYYSSRYIGARRVVN